MRRHFFQIVEPSCESFAGHVLIVNCVIKLWSKLLQSTNFNTLTDLNIYITDDFLIKKYLVHCSSTIMFDFIILCIILVIIVHVRVTINILIFKHAETAWIRDNKNSEGWIQDKLIHCLHRYLIKKGREEDVIPIPVCPM